MKFYDYQDNWLALKQSGLSEQLGIQDREHMYQWLAKAHNSNPLGYRHMMFEMMWNCEGKPYYDVYPSIIPMLIKLNLNFPGNAISGIDGDLYVCDHSKSEQAGPFHTIPNDQLKEFTAKLATAAKTRQFTNLLIRLPEVDHGLHFEDPKYGHTTVRTIFTSFQPVTRACNSDHVTLGLIIGIDIAERDETGVFPIHTMRVFPLDERPVEECIHALPKHEIGNEGIQIPDELMTKCIKLAITLCLLEDNPDLIEPDVLSRDRHRMSNANQELLQRLIDKARRKGKYGFLVGKMMEEQIQRGEMSPHSRRPHTALVWTGEGRAIPKIVPRKGSLIHRKKIENVPTGYQTDKEPMG